MNLAMQLPSSKKLPDASRMYAAVRERDPRFEGVFFFAVRTTGVFCRPGCRARTPDRKNVEFFGSTKAALDHGYRPCKLCRPMERAGESPAWIKPLLDAIAAEPAERWNDARLRAEGYEPARVRRWFKAHHGQTFQAHLRALRINSAFGRLRQEKTVTETALESGYESLSGFGEAFKKATGHSPRAGRELDVVHVARIATPLGPMLAGASDAGLCLLEFADRRGLETQLTRVQKRLNARALPGTHPVLARLAAQLEEYFSGARRDFTVPLVFTGTEFQEKVWRALLTIPCGETRSYQEQAALIGAPGSVRAVARANGDNCIAILVPCHRVIGKDGSLTGYAGGLPRKQALLDLERGADLFSAPHQF